MEGVFLAQESVRGWRAHGTVARRDLKKSSWFSLI